MYPAISIPTEVYDLLQIDVNDPLPFRHLEYAILNNERTTIRKGFFKGFYTQLRLTHLPDGLYFLTIGACPSESTELRFIKRSL
jgi:hypothetical protein